MRLFKNYTGLEKASARWRYLNFIDWMLPLYIIFSLPLFYFGLHYDFIFKWIAVLSTVIYLLIYGVPKGGGTNTFNLFLIIVAFSFVQYAYNDRPITLYFKDVSNYITAMLFFYVGVTDNRSGRPFYDKLMLSVSVVFALGLICYVTMPSWFMTRTIEAINLHSVIQYNETNVLEHMRFGAFWGDSYSVSHLSVFCVAIALFSITYSKGRERIISLCCLTIGFLSSIASMHRASIAGSCVAIIAYIYFNIKMNRKKGNAELVGFIVVAIGIIFLLLQYFGDRLEQVGELIFERVDNNLSLSKALQERKFTDELMKSMRFFIFGHGLGSGGVGARAYGLPGISDMQYIKMLYENGLVGAILFMSIIVRFFKRSIKNISFYLSELIIVSFFMIAMLGSNSLSIYYFIVFPFWYAIGRTFNNNISVQIKNNKCKS